MPKLIICDDQSIVREGLNLMLALEPDFTVLALCENGEQAVAACQTHSADLLLIDLNMPVLNGVDAIKRIIAHNPAQKILVLTTFDDDQWLFAALAAGANGYLLKDTCREDLITAIRGTLAGQHYLDPKVAGQVVSQLQNKALSQQTSNEHQHPFATLSDKELAVLRLIAQGKNNQLIANELHLSEGTIKNYVSSIFVKLEVNDRTQAAILAVKAGLDA